MYDKNNIELFKSFFRGRQDVYATRWEKEGKSGYMPAYRVDKDYSKNEFLQFNDEALLNHFLGKV